MTDKYKVLIEKKNLLKNNIHLLSKEILENYTTDFNINFTHDSTAIEGNTLTLKETKLLLEDKISVGSKDLREVYEIVNHEKAWNYVKTLIKKGKNLDETIIKEIHRILMENIMEGGEYRDIDVRITGAKHSPPSPIIAKIELNEFFKKLKNNDFNEIAYSAYTHAEFVRIHPFTDGNGRISRIIMNYQLVKNDFLPISIKTKDKNNYYDALEEYGINNNLNPFIKMIYELEEEQLDFYLNAIKLRKNKDL
ncbi:Fic family protein [Methanobrevibacter sp. TMH8]|uniref:Fic family protein n=1 Tax=Methanobrevibacter sp. TMH8 TaxID=2848611 RepID=UPI001CCC7113|nr:Fic family protein [Methanobrevibacter sp. TMH8]MBZ9570246.1 Fic family protein [Methanobrevibacter sp. TMH8]